MYYLFVAVSVIAPPLYMVELSSYSSDVGEILLGLSDAIYNLVGFFQSFWTNEKMP